MKVTVSYGDHTTSTADRLAAHERMLATLDKHKRKVARTREVVFSSADPVFAYVDGVYQLSIEYTEV